MNQQLKTVSKYLYSYNHKVGLGYYCQLDHINKNDNIKEMPFP